jgi:hypothetical protein
MSDTANRSRNPDRLIPGCVRLLEEAGFTYDGRIGAWLNISAGRVIAFDRVANHSREWIAAWLGLSPTHRRFMANRHDDRTVRFGSPPLRVGRRLRIFKHGKESIRLAASTMTRRLH